MTHSQNHCYGCCWSLIGGLFFPKWTVTHSHNHCYVCCWLLIGGLSLSPCGLWLTHITIVMVVFGCWLEASVFAHVDCDSLTQPLLWLLLVVDWRPQFFPMWTVTHSHNHYYGCCWLLFGGLNLSPCGLWLTHITIFMVFPGHDWRPVFPQVGCNSLT